MSSHVIDRAVVRKANQAVIEGKSADFSFLPQNVVAVVRDHMPTPSKTQHAFAEAQRSQEANRTKG
jgi:hypothetical protein